MSEELYDLCDNLKREIRELAHKSDISPTELERLYKAVDIIKDIKTIEAMENAGYSTMAPYSYDDGMTYTNRGGRYSYEGNSYRRGRDSMGRYVSHDDSAMHDKEHLMQQLDEMRAKVDRM